MLEKAEKELQLLYSVQSLQTAWDNSFNFYFKINLKTIVPWGSKYDYRGLCKEERYCIAHARSQGMHFGTCKVAVFPLTNAQVDSIPYQPHFYERDPKRNCGSCVDFPFQIWKHLRQVLNSTSDVRVSGPR